MNYQNFIYMYRHGLTRRALQNLIDSTPEKWAKFARFLKCLS